MHNVTVRTVLCPLTPGSSAVRRSLNLKNQKYFTSLLALTVMVPHLLMSYVEAYSKICLMAVTGYYDLLEPETE
jgi:hypothetical protein